MNLTGTTLNLVGGEGSQSGQSGGVVKISIGSGSGETSSLTAKSSTINMNTGSKYQGQKGFAKIEVTGNATLQEGSQLNVNVGASEGATSIVNVAGTLTVGSKEAAEEDKTAVTIGKGGSITVNNGRTRTGVSNLYNGTVTTVLDKGNLNLMGGTLALDKGATLQLAAGANFVNRGTVNLAEGSTLVFAPTEANTTFAEGFGSVSTAGKVTAQGVTLTITDGNTQTQAAEPVQASDPQDQGATSKAKYNTDTLTLTKGASLEAGGLAFAKNKDSDGIPTLTIASGTKNVIGGTLANLDEVMTPTVAKLEKLDKQFKSDVGTVFQVSSSVNATKGILLVAQATEQADTSDPGVPGAVAENGTSAPTMGTVKIGNDTDSTLLLVKGVGQKDKANSPFVTDSDAEGTSFEILGADKTAVVITDIDDVVKTGERQGQVASGFETESVSKGTSIVSTNPLYDLAWIAAKDGSNTSAYTISVNEDEKNKESVEAVPAQAASVGVIAMNMTLGSLFDHGTKLAGYGHDEGRGDLWIDLNWNHTKNDYSASGFDTGYKGDLYGATFGGDYQVRKNLAVGLAFAVGSGQTKGRGVASGVKADTTYYGGNLYAVADTRYANIIGNIGYMQADNKIKGSLGKPKAKASVISAGVRVEKDFHIKEKLDVIPYIGINYMRIDSKSFNYGQFHYDKADSNLVEFPIGVAFMGNYNTNSGFKLKPMLDLQIKPTAGKNKMATSYNIINFAGPEGSGSFDSEVASKVMYKAKIGLNATKGRHSLGLHLGVGVNGGSGKRVDTALLAKYRFSF